jgi:hypothetical protein
MTAADGRARQECGLELMTSNSSCPRGPVDGPLSCGAQRDGCLRGAENCTPPSRPPEKIRGAADFRPTALQWLQPPRLGLPEEASIAVEVDGLGVDTERATGGGVWRRPAAPAVVTYPGRQSPGRRCFPRHRWGPRTNPSRRRVGVSAPERTGEHVAAVEAADRSGVAPESAGSKRTTPEQGLKCVAPEPGSSDRPAKKPWVRSKM